MKKQTGGLRQQWWMEVLKMNSEEWGTQLVSERSTGQDRHVKMVR